MIHKRYSKSDRKTLLKNRSTNVTQKLFHKRYSKIDPQTLLKKWSTNVTQNLNHKHYSKIDPQTLLKWSANVTPKLTQKRYSIVSNKYGIEKSSKTNTLSWLFFDWKIAATSYKKFKTTLWNINYQL